MTVSRYVEVNAQRFLNGLGILLNNEDMLNDILNDEHYILRIAPDGIEICYPEDKSKLPS